MQKAANEKQREEMDHLREQEAELLVLFNNHSLLVKEAP